MKNMKKLFSLLLALVMVLGLATTAFADDVTYTLTLNGAQEGHTYTAYQIFAGDLNGSTLSNIVWGSGVSSDGQTELGNAADNAATLVSSTDADAFAAKVAEHLGTAAGSVTIAENATTGEIKNLPAGYYLVKTTGVSAENSVYTAYIMEVVKDTTATIKADVPEVKKEVDDKDVSIGDIIEYTLTIDLPSNLSGYESYELTVTDTLSPGLVYQNFDLVLDGGTTVLSNPADFDFTPSGAANRGFKLVWEFKDLIASGAKAGSNLIISYRVKVDSSVAIGTDGNSNKVYLEYSNNPNGEGTGKTPAEEVKVYTWEIPVFKYTGNDTPLAGAGFTLYTDENCTKAVTVSQVSDSTAYKVNPASETSEITTDGSGKFEIEGLAQGTYYLKETSTPAGYNTCEVVTVTIGANGVLTVNNATVSEVKVLNNTGSTLPSTGGMGTTLFYVVGGMLVLAAVVLLVTKRRMSAEQ